MYLQKTKSTVSENGHYPKFHYSTTSSTSVASTRGDGFEIVENIDNRNKTNDSNYSYDQAVLLDDSNEMSISTTESTAMNTIDPDRKWDIRAVGYVESPYKERLDTPKQATISRHDGGARPGTIRLLPGNEK